MSNEILPNLIIAGASKSGTTSLYNYLRLHPDVLMSSWKSPAYFSDIPGSVESWSDYTELFSHHNGEAIIGEASPSYLYYPNAANEIWRRLGPEVRLIFILRNPIDMTYSLWKHNVRSSIEDREFLCAVEANAISENINHSTGSDRIWLGRFEYQSRGLYEKQLKEFYRAVPSENIKILVFEDFFSNPHIEYPKLCKFLGIDIDTSIDFGIFNRGGRSRFDYIQKLMLSDNIVRRISRRVLSKRVRGVIGLLISQLNIDDTRYDALSLSHRKRLWKYFEDDVCQLDDLLGMDLSNKWRP